jgi:hypothetical protein
MEEAMKKYLVWSLMITLALVFVGCSSGSSHSGQSKSSEPWSFYVTNVSYYSAEQRGWKSVVFDIVLESNTSAPKPMPWNKYVAVRDSTGTWREPPRHFRQSDPQSFSLVPAGVRFKLRVPDPVRGPIGDQEILIPESATPEEFRILACNDVGNRGHCSSIIGTVERVTPSNQFVFPFSEPPSDIPLLENPVTVKKEGQYKITFHENYRLQPGSFGSMELILNVDIQNLGNNDLDTGSWDLFARIVQESGRYKFDDNVFCRSEDNRDGVVPPGYTDPLECQVWIGSEEDSFKNTWVGISLGNENIVQLVIDK